MVGFISVMYVSLWSVEILIHFVAFNASRMAYVWAIVECGDPDSFCSIQR